MRSIATQALTKRLQKVFWLYLTNNFIVTSMSDLRVIEPAATYDFIPITWANYSRVRDFRDEHRISEYRDKLARNELGFFAVVDGHTAGSIWATINRSQLPAVARMYMRLLPNEALIHDIVTGEMWRGRGVGPFMVCRIASILLCEHALTKVIIDVNARNTASLRMMNKTGLQVQQHVLYVSAFGTVVLRKTLRDYSRGASHLNG